MDHAFAKSHNYSQVLVTLDIGTEMARNIPHMDFIRSYLLRNALLNPHATFRKMSPT